MREMSVTEQRYKAVLAVIGDGRTVSEVATDWGVSRRTMHRWLVRYEGDGLEGLNNRSHRPAQKARCRPCAFAADNRSLSIAWGITVSRVVPDGMGRRPSDLAISAGGRQLRC